MTREFLKERGWRLQDATEGELGESEGRVASESFRRAA